MGSHHGPVVAERPAWAGRLGLLRRRLLGWALVLLRGQAAKRLLGPWVIWLLFFGAETYTSGLNVTLNHMGPGSLIAGIWFLAACDATVAGSSSAEWNALGVRCWPGRGRRSVSAWLGLAVRGPRHRLDAGESPTCRMLIVMSKKSNGSSRGCRRIRSSLTSGSVDSRRKGSSPGIRLRCIGCRGEVQPVGVGDFSGLLGRLEHHEYQKDPGPQSG